MAVPITQHAVDCEIEELKLYDYVFSPSAEVDQSVQEAGVPEKRVVPTSFGWSPSRFASTSLPRKAGGPLRFLFVGTACVRKGIPALLQAWKKARVAGELVIVGNAEAAIQDMMTEAMRNGSVRHIPFTDKIEAFYRSSDVFVLPTLEEGGVQVTLEAGGCGLPIITTAMGAARLVKHDVNGLIVEAGNVEDLTRALQRMAGDAALRSEFSRRIEQDAAPFAYDKVSNLHGRIIAGLLRSAPFGVDASHKASHTAKF
nr:glycosyltransferase [Rhizobium sp. ARZ01]